MDYNNESSFFFFFSGCLVFFFFQFYPFCIWLILDWKSWFALIWFVWDSQVSRKKNIWLILGLGKNKINFIDFKQLKLKGWIWKLTIQGPIWTKKRRIGENEQFEQKREELARIVSAWERPPGLDGACNNLQILTPFLGVIQKELSWSTAMCGVCQW